MKYKVGDKVRIKSLDWYNENKNEFGDVKCSLNCSLTKSMSIYCGSIQTIESVVNGGMYWMKENPFNWADEMIEGLVEEESLTAPLKHPEDSPLAMLFHKTLILPEGYQFVDENGNVINATKIVLEKKKKEYPKTYEECLNVLAFVRPEFTIEVLDEHYERLISSLYKLLICRDAYWKIAGEEMELDKPWKPDYSGTFEHGTPIKYVIYNIGTHIVKERKSSPNHILAFPTAEMRDAFYENFKSEIEICKELL